MTVIDSIDAKTELKLLLLTLRNTTISIGIIRIEKIIIILLNSL